MSTWTDDPVDESVSPDSATHDPANLESRTDATCYRCDRSLDPDCWIRLTAQPGPGVTDAYDASSRPCCPDCVAAVGLLELEVASESRSSASD